MSILYRIVGCWLCTVKFIRVYRLSVAVLLREFARMTLELYGDNHQHRSSDGPTRRNHVS